MLTRTGIIGLALASLPAAYCFAGSAAVPFETGLIDLDSGQVEVVELAEPVAGGADLKFGYHADRMQNCVTVLAGLHTVGAYLEGKGFDSVSASDIDTAIFVDEVDYRSCDPSDTLLIQTDEGAYFKVGNFFEDGVEVQFDYEQLQ